MCEQCEKLTSRISRYRRFMTGGLDAMTAERINALIVELQLRKDAAHR